jgi:hypothetical protein
LKFYINEEEVDIPDALLVQTLSDAGYSLIRTEHLQKVFDAWDLLKDLMEMNNGN